MKNVTPQWNAKRPENLAEAAGKYYSDPEIVSWYNNIHGVDYVGVGMWPAHITEVDGIPRGFGFEQATTAMHVRDDLFLKHILN